ncbi:MAG: DnaJ domain-containing protein [Gammaproteobacteria bacterium]|nr:DnaJ domain-containing protein [Gammaproteobacteria bacterium]MBU1732600.1 DnaJ domain-containing protein [Gammaproteobacteria bacterium]MBU1893463.1 DnaJ domain-containing protein [Gammaproteobacteria bacterium]
MNDQKNYYEEMGVEACATMEDIQAAYERLLQHLTSREHGLTQENATRQINLLNHAYWTLSDLARRAGYDAALASSGDNIQFAVEIREARWTPQKILLIVIGGLIAIGMAIQIVFTLYSHYRARQFMENQESLAEMRNQSEFAAAREEERQRRAEESRIAAEERRQERERQEIERRQERELEDNRRYAAQVSGDLHRAEEQAKREAEREQRRAEQEERMRQEAERRRIEQQKYMWQQQLRR